MTGRKNIVVILTCLLVWSSVCFGEPFFDGRLYHVPGIIHMDSSISGGENTPEQLAASAVNSGAGFAVLTDHDTQKVSYGFWPLRDIFMVSYARDSIRSYGFGRYIDDIHRINQQLGSFAFLPGVEAVPYYYWDRDPLTGELTLRNLHAHLLVMGIDDPDVLAGLPSIESGYRQRTTMRSLLGLAWLFPLLLGIILLGNHEGEHGLNRQLFLQWENIVGVTLVVVSGTFLVNNYPFKERVVTPYGGNRGAMPYQELIDYVNAHDGLVFWAHPEAAYKEKVDAGEWGVIGGILDFLFQNGFAIETDPYFSLLNTTVDYTGFAIFFEGSKIVGSPGGVWDSILMQFCAGSRARPMWAISEIDMETIEDPRLATRAQTVVLVENQNRDAYLEALRLGRMYCYRDGIHEWLHIPEYAIHAGGKRAVSGDIIRYADDARLLFSVAMDKDDRAFDVVVVRDGAVYERREIQGTGTIEIPLPEPDDDMGYVRVALYEGSMMRVATNPIFIRR